MKATWAFLIGLLISGGLALALIQSFRLGAATVPLPVALDDSWVLKRLTECDKICGPVPFEVDATRDRIVCTCGRPERVRPLRIVPKGELR